MRLHPHPRPPWCLNSHRSSPTTTRKTKSPYAGRDSAPDGLPLLLLHLRPRRPNSVSTLAPSRAACALARRALVAVTRPPSRTRAVRASPAPTLVRAAGASVLLLVRSRNRVMVKLMMRIVCGASRSRLTFSIGRHRAFDVFHHLARNDFDFLHRLFSFFTLTNLYQRTNESSVVL